MTRIITENENENENDSKFFNTILTGMVDACYADTALPSTSYASTVPLHTSTLYQNAETNNKIPKFYESLLERKSIPLISFFKKIFNGISSVNSGNLSDSSLHENMNPNRLFPFPLLRHNSENLYGEFYSFYNGNFNWDKYGNVKDKNFFISGDETDNTFLFLSLSSEKLLHLLPSLERSLFSNSLGTSSLSISALTATSLIDSFLKNVWEKAGENLSEYSVYEDKYKNENENENEKNNAKKEMKNKCKNVLKIIIEECMKCFDSASAGCVNVLEVQDPYKKEWLHHMHENGTGPKMVGGGGGLGGSKMGPGPGVFGPYNTDNTHSTTHSTHSTHREKNGNSNTPHNELWAYHTMRMLLCCTFSNTKNAQERRRKEKKKSEANSDTVHENENENENRRINNEVLEEILDPEILLRLFKISNFGDVSFRFRIFEIVTLLLSRLNIAIKEDAIVPKRAEKVPQKVVIENVLCKEKGMSEFENDVDNTEKRTNAQNKNDGKTFLSKFLSGSGYIVTLTNERKILELLGNCIKSETSSEIRENSLSQKPKLKPFSRYLRAVCGVLLQCSILRKSLGFGFCNHVQESVIEDWILSDSSSLKSFENENNVTSEKRKEIDIKKTDENNSNKNNGNDVGRNSGSPVLLVTQLSPNSITVTWRNLPVDGREKEKEKVERDKDKEKGKEKEREKGQGIVLKSSSREIKGIEKESSLTDSVTLPCDVSAKTQNSGKEKRENRFHGNNSRKLEKNEKSDSRSEKTEKSEKSDKTEKSDKSESSDKKGRISIGGIVGGNEISSTMSTVGLYLIPASYGDIPDNYQPVLLSLPINGTHRIDGLQPGKHITEFKC